MILMSTHQCDILLRAGWLSVCLAMCMLVRLKERFLLMCTALVCCAFENM